MSTKKRVLLKLTGEIFLTPDKKDLSSEAIGNVINQITTLQQTHQFGLVIGGGNFFRGTQHGTKLGIRPNVGHYIGMLATMMNGLILKDLVEQSGLPASLFCALTCPEVGEPVVPHRIAIALEENHTLIFTGGTGNPFFTTDTSAILRGLQMGADEVWKGTSVDGIYTADPKKNPDATLLKQVNYRQALENKYGIMDAAAFALGAEHKMPLRIFNIFTSNALVLAAHDNNFGTIIS